MWHHEHMAERWLLRKSTFTVTAVCNRKCFRPPHSTHCLFILAPVMWKRMWNLERVWGKRFDVRGQMHFLCRSWGFHIHIALEFKRTHSVPAPRQTQVFSTSYPRMLQQSLSRFLMWVERRGIHSTWKPRDEKKPKKGWWKETRKSTMDFFLFLNGLIRAKHGVGYERKMWYGILVTRGLTRDKKLAGVVVFLVSHISLCCGEWAWKEGALSKFYVAFWKQNKPSSEQYTQLQYLSDNRALIFLTSQILPVKHPVWNPPWSLFSLVGVP